MMMLMSTVMMLMVRYRDGLEWIPSWSSPDRPGRYLDGSGWHPVGSGRLQSDPRGPTNYRNPRNPQNPHD